MRSRSLPSKDMHFPLLIPSGSLSLGIIITFAAISSTHFTGTRKLLQ
jgi:hypothetical protein